LVGQKMRRFGQLLGQTMVGFGRYGSQMMLPHEPLFINPQDVRFGFDVNGHSDPYFGSHMASGSIHAGDWDSKVLPVENQWKYQAVVRRFRHGITWEETGIIDRMMKLIEQNQGFDELYTLADVTARYSDVDRLYDEVTATGHLKTRREMGVTWWSERGGIYGHLNRNGEFLRFRNGNHRFAIAVCAGLKVIPVDVGLVHPGAIEKGVIPQMRKRVIYT